ncbi:MAG: hypothetical protein C4538_00195 [Nitrospiraceae bacterium]|nr:MAG: hypothetical protein C4538_00195 [Nitrospiraceae bacterium]
MLRNYFLVNVLLLIIIGFLGLKAYKVYSYKMDIPSSPPAVQAQKDGGESQDEDKTVDPSLFQIISNMDLFRPSRSPYREEAVQQAAPKIPPRLFGTIILGNDKTAILEDPNTKTTRLYRLNESIGGYVLSDILEDKVILSWNTEKTEVRLREEKQGLPAVRQIAMPPPQIPQAPQQQTPQVQPPPVMQQQPAIPPAPRQRRLPQRPIPPR